MAEAGWRFLETSWVVCNFYTPPPVGEFDCRVYSNFAVSRPHRYGRFRSEVPPALHVNVGSAFPDSTTFSPGMRGACKTSDALMEDRRQAIFNASEANGMLPRRLLASLTLIVLSVATANAAERVTENFVVEAPTKELAIKFGEYAE